MHGLMHENGKCPARSHARSHARFSCTVLMHGLMHGLMGALGERGSRVGGEEQKGWRGKGEGEREVEGSRYSVQPILPTLAPTSVSASSPLPCALSHALPQLHLHAHNITDRPGNPFPRHELLTAVLETVPYGQGERPATRLIMCNNVSI